MPSRRLFHACISLALIFLAHKPPPTHTHINVYFHTHEGTCINTINMDSKASVTHPYVFRYILFGGWS